MCDRKGEEEGCVVYWERDRDRAGATGKVQMAWVPMETGLSRALHPAIPCLVLKIQEQHKRTVACDLRHSTAIIPRGRIAQ